MLRYGSVYGMIKVRKKHGGIDVIKEFNTDGFRGNVLVYQDGELLYEYENGFADLANEIPNTIDTRFATASAGKAFVAVGKCCDIIRFWKALSENKLLSKEMTETMLEKQSGDGADPEEGWYGLGFWLIDNPGGKDFAYFQGCDPGVSFISEYNRNNGIVSVAVSNYGDNVWEIMRNIRKEFYLSRNH